MSNDIELEALFHKCQAVKQHVDYAYEKMESERENKEKALAKMNNEYRYMTKYESHFESIWDEFRRLSKNNRSRIESLNHKAKFAQEAEIISINAEIAELAKEIHEAKKEAKRRAPNKSINNYDQAEYFYEESKRKYAQAKMEYDYLKTLYNRYKTAYEQAKIAFEQQNQPSN